MLASGEYETRIQDKSCDSAVCVNNEHCLLTFACWLACRPFPHWPTAAVSFALPTHTATAALVSTAATMFGPMSPQCWVDPWDEALKGFKDLPAAWAAAGSSSRGLQAVHETPPPQKILGHLLASAQSGVDIPMTAWKKLVVTDEVIQFFLQVELLGPTPSNP